ncbi:MAG: hypothetical protein HZB16_08265 [Armatimonadetes bacterium]|nr:hypothetical protein [Armatimonadota bacterium]
MTAVLLALLLALGAAPEQPLTGRYVRLEADAGHTAELHLAELEAYVGGRNIAIRKPVSASSSMAPFLPERAVDGIVQYDWGRDASFWTTAVGGAQWWEVDLGQEVAIQKIVLYNRLDCCQERLNGAVLRVLTGDRREVYRQVLDSRTNPIEQVWSEPVIPPTDFTTQTPAQRRAALAPRFVKPAADPAEVMPVGAGDLSAMVSYTNALELHLTKSDAFGAQAEPYHYSPTLVSPGHVKLDFGIKPEAILSYEQRLDFDRGSVITELRLAEGTLRAEAFGEMGGNALLVAVDDPRARPNAQIQMSCSRATMVASEAGGVHLLREVSALAENGQPPADPAKANPGDRILGLGIATAASLTPLGRRYWLVLATRVTRDGRPEAAAAAHCRQLVAADKDKLTADHLAWWRSFWQSAWLDLRGKDADALTRLWTTGYYSYASVAATSAVPPKFNGGPGLVHDDDCSWGWGYWWQNTRELIWPLLAGNRLDLARTYLDFYDRQFAEWQAATRQGGKLGIRMWEGASPPRAGAPPAHTPTPFDAAALAKASADLRMEQCGSGYNARSICQSTELAQLMLDYAAYAHDADYERQVAAPWLREAALFWLSWLRLGDDGLYHSTVSDAAEMWWKIKDPAPDLAATRWCFARVLRDGARFGFEPELLAMARDRLARLAPLPTGAVRMKGADVVSVDRTVDQLAPFGDLYDDRQSHNMEVPELYPVYPFAVIDAGSAPAELALAVAAFRSRAHGNAAGWSQCPVQAARLRLPETLSVIMDHVRRHQKWPYGGWNCVGHPLKDSRYGVTDVPYFDSVGVNLTAVQESLIQCHTGTVDLLPAVSPQWAGRFRLRARQAIVEVEFQPKRQITWTTLRSAVDGSVMVANPWPRARVADADGMRTVTERQIRVRLAPDQAARLAPVP